MPPASRPPSTRLGACEPCRRGDHGACSESHLGGDPCGSDTTCTCYDDAWEWHDRIAR